MHEEGGRDVSSGMGGRGNLFSQPLVYHHTLSHVLPLSSCLITASSIIIHPLSTHCLSHHHFIYYSSRSPFSLPDPTLLPPFFPSLPPSLRISTVQGAAACCCACVCRPLFTLIIGIGSVLLGFHPASTETSLNQS